MASKYWIKLYHEILNDPKMGRLNHKQWRRTIEVFLMAGEMDSGGLLPSLYDMSYQLRISEEETLADLKSLAEFGIVSHGNECWGVVNFAKRQAASSNAERTKRHRERQRKAAAWLPNSVPDIDTDKDIDTDTNEDKDLDTDTEQIEKEKLDKEPSPSTSSWTEEDRRRLRKELMKSTPGATTVDLGPGLKVVDGKLVDD